VAHQGPDDTAADAPGPGARSGDVVRVSRAIEFSSSLAYRLPQLSAEENRQRFGQKALQHGHNYRLEVTVRGVPDPATGMVVNLVDLKELMEREVMSRFDHRDLNADTGYFQKAPPTPENLALVIAGLLRSALPPGQLDRVRLHQDADLYVDVVEDGA
jgi:6-pyruvoyltetrahydropterin/6-carboxytetrahydropterin synthase